MMVVDGVGNFLKVRLPIRLDDGRTVNYLVWIYVEADVTGPKSPLVGSRAAT
jgi:hypothetical protein